MSDDVISIAHEVQVKRRSHGCRHYRIEVDEESRLIECLDCDAKVDPVEWILGCVSWLRVMHHQKLALDEHAAKLQARRKRAGFSPIAPRKP